ncbi:MAG: hypothetical protein ACRDOK_19620 [Streptosporangiaceae bacterium]
MGLGFAAAHGYADPLTAGTIARYAAGHVVAARCSRRSGRRSAR